MAETCTVAAPASRARARICMEYPVLAVWLRTTTPSSASIGTSYGARSAACAASARTRAARALWAIRLRLGALFGWDDVADGPGSRAPTLRDRLPADLRDAPRGPDFGTLPFSSLYLLDDEWAAEIANRTMHGVMHLGWVPDDNG